MTNPKVSCQYDLKKKSLQIFLNGTFSFANLTGAIKSLGTGLFFFFYIHL